VLNGSTPVPGATGPTLEFADASAAVGSYTCVATNASGTAASDAATISLTGSADLGRLVNISCRAVVGAGGTLIAGFVIDGSTARTVLVRASGPALGAFGVAGALADPELGLYFGPAELDSNSGWGGDPHVAAAAAAVGAFAWTSPASHDSALLVTLPPGAYTAQVSGASGDTGVALIEVYEVP